MMENEKKSLARMVKENIKVYKISLVFSVMENKLYFEFIFLYILNLEFSCGKLFVFVDSFIINIFL